MLAGMHGGATPGKVIMGLKIVKCDQVQTDKFSNFFLFLLMSRMLTGTNSTSTV